MSRGRKGVGGGRGGGVTDVPAGLRLHADGRHRRSWKSALQLTCSVLFGSTWGVLKSVPLSYTLGRSPICGRTARLHLKTLERS